MSSRDDSQPRSSTAIVLLLLVLTGVVLAGCTPSPEANVVAYLLSERLGTLSREPDSQPPGALTGFVHHNDQPLEGASVIVSERLGETHHAVTDIHGRYRIEGIPPGQYVPAAIAPGYDPAVPRDLLGIPLLVTIEPLAATEAPPIELTPHLPAPLPTPLADAVKLTATGEYTATSAFPPDSVAHASSFAFEHDGIVNEWLRVYRPIGTAADDEYPMLLTVYPGPTPNWEAVSVALASAGYVVVAIAPMDARGLDIQAHAMDARIALNLALDGSLGPNIAGDQAVAMGGSFSSPVVRRMILDEADKVSAWIVMGGISDAYALSNDFYENRIEIPAMHNLAIPSFGLPNLYPLQFLRYSSIYSAGELPPTMIIHTVNDRTTLIDQAYKLESALKEAGVPVEAFYYEDESHYLQLGAYTPESSKQMYQRVLEFLEKHTADR